MPKTHRLTLPTPIHAAALRGEVSMLLVRMKPQPLDPSGSAIRGTCTNEEGCEIPTLWALNGFHDSPYAPGDLIACREPWATRPDLPVLARRVYRADYEEPADFPYGHIYDETTRWQPASRMPLSACRLWFRVQSVEARRMIEVTEEEARACGFDSCTAADQLRQAWLAGGTGLGDWAWKLKVERTESNG